MKPCIKLQLLSCLLLYASSVQAIMVKFGTKGGPIEPPTPEPQPAQPRVYRAPAPVWEERSNDTPDPNAHWRPFIPKQTYTHLFIASPPTTQEPLNSAQRFVNLYIPSQPRTFFSPEASTHVLSSQQLPGFGLRYFAPTFQKEYRQEDAKHNQIETNHVDSSRDASSDLLWKYEKDAVRRTLRNTLETVPVYQWQWPAFVPHQ